MCIKSQLWNLFNQDRPNWQIDGEEGTIKGIMKEEVCKKVCRIQFCSDAVHRNQCIQSKRLLHVCRARPSHSLSARPLAGPSELGSEGLLRIEHLDDRSTHRLRASASSTSAYVGRASRIAWQASVLREELHRHPSRVRARDLLRLWTHSRHSSTPYNIHHTTWVTLVLDLYSHLDCIQFGFTCKLHLNLDLNLHLNCIWVWYCFANWSSLEF